MVLLDSRIMSTDSPSPCCHAHQFQVVTDCRGIPLLPRKGARIFECVGRSLTPVSQAAAVGEDSQLACVNLVISDITFGRRSIVQVVPACAGSAWSGVCRARAKCMLADATPNLHEPRLSASASTTSVSHCLDGVIIAANASGGCSYSGSLGGTAGVTSCKA